jgi:hypothetical protein
MGEVSPFFQRIQWMMGDILFAGFFSIAVFC